jgi:hypothetical protein
MKSRESGRKTGGILADVSPLVPSLSFPLELIPLFSRLRRIWDSEKPFRRSLGLSRASRRLLTRRQASEEERCEFASRFAPFRALGQTLRLFRTLTASSVLCECLWTSLVFKKVADRPAFVSLALLWSSGRTRSRRRQSRASLRSPRITDLVDSVVSSSDFSVSVRTGLT